MNHFLIYGVLVLLTACSYQNDEGVTISREKLPDQESWESTIIITREGKKRAVIKSGHLAKYNDQKEVILDQNVDADFFSIEEEHMSNLKSDKAYVYESSDNLLAIGNVVVVSDSGVTLFTDTLYWNNIDEMVTTNDTVMLTTESDDTLHGIGFESNVDLSRWKIMQPWGVTSRE